MKTSTLFPFTGKSRMIWEAPVFTIIGKEHVEAYLSFLVLGTRNEEMFVFEMHPFVLFYFTYVFKLSLQH